MSDIETVAVIGAGTMGNGIAHVFALHDRAVRLADVSEERLDHALGAIEKNLGRQAEKGILDRDEIGSVMAQISTVTSASEAADGADLVVEAVPERFELKAELFRTLDEAAPAGAIFASNTSSISITALGAQVSEPGRVVGMHFMNPVPVMELVEVVRGLATDDGTVDAVVGLSEELGKTPVVVNDAPGFVSNRVLMPMINEAAFALMEGVADAEAIDTVMTLGMRHPMGPLALADLIGLDTCLSILEVLHGEMGDDRYRPCPLLRRYVDAGWLGRKSGRGFHRYD